MPGRSKIDEVIRTIRQGGTIAYPAETMYGLGGNGLSAALVEKIREVKGRHEGKGLILLVDTVDRAESLCREFPDRARALAEKYWPGPLTLLLPAADSDLAAGADGKVAIRLPAPPWLREWVRLSDCPLLSTSANRSGEFPARTAEELREGFADSIDLLVTGPAFDEGIPPTTIVDVTVDPPMVVREGALSLEL